MDPGSKKNLPLADKKKVKSKSTKPESGLRISADPGLNFNYSGMESLVNKPIIKELDGDPELDQIAERFRRTIPTAWMKEKVPGYDPEECINIIRQVVRDPELRKMREDLGNPALRKTMKSRFKHLLRESGPPNVSREPIRSTTPVDVNQSAGPTG